MKGVKGMSLRTDWYCPKCGASVATYVTLSCPPTHRCPKQAMRTTNLQKKEENK